MTAATGVVATDYDPRPGVNEALAAVKAAEAAERAQSLGVDRVREEVAVGRLAVGDLHRARRRLAALQEATGQAQALVRGRIRDYEAARVAEAERRENDRRALVATLVPEREALERELAEAAVAFSHALTDLEARLSEWSARAGTAQPPPGLRTGILAGSIDHLRGDGQPISNAKEAARRLAQAASPRR